MKKRAVAIVPVSKTQPKPRLTWESIPSLWPNQVAALKRIDEYLLSSSGGSALVQMPTGSGKTGIIAVSAPTHGSGRQGSDHPVAVESARRATDGRRELDTVASVESRKSLVRRHRNHPAADQRVRHKNSVSCRELVGSDPCRDDAGTNRYPGPPTPFFAALSQARHPSSTWTKATASLHRNGRRASNHSERA